MLEQGSSGGSGQMELRTTGKHKLENVNQPEKYYRQKTEPKKNKTKRKMTKKKPAGHKKDKISIFA